MIPQLYVFAGPNGAGKSSFSGLMLGPGIPLFDGNKEFAKHKVSLENIKANHDEGLKNLQAYFSDFDRVNLLQNFARINEPALFTPLMHVNKGQIIEQATGLPDWAALFSATAFPH